MSEADLITSARAGDAAAYESLVRQHQEVVFRLAYLLLGDAADAEDVAQEAFIRAFKALGTFDLNRSFRPWLCRITVNLARNRHRSLGRYWAAIRRLAQATSQPSSLSSAGDPDRAQAHALREAIQRLPVPDQEVIYLRFYLGLPEAEAAAVLNIATGTVKSRQHRALLRLRAVVLSDFPDLQEGVEDGR